VLHFHFDVRLRGGRVYVPEYFLDSGIAVALIQQRGGKASPQGVRPALATAAFDACGRKGPGNNGVILFLNKVIDTEVKMWYNKRG